MKTFIEKHNQKIIVGLVILLSAAFGLKYYSEQKSDVLKSSLVENAGLTMHEKPRPDHVPGEILIKVKDAENFQVTSATETSIRSINEINQTYHVQEFKQAREIHTQVQLPGIYRVKILNDDHLSDVIQQYKANPDIEFAEPNGMMHITRTPNDTSYDLQWGLHNTGQTGGESDADIDAPEAWDTTTGSSSAIIAVVDSGVDTDHPDIQSKIIAGYNFVEGNTDPNPTPDGIDNDGDGSVDGGVQHGTHVSSIAAGVSNNGEGTSGVDWNARIMGVKVLDDEGSGSYFDVASGIEWAGNNRADVINMSLGGGYSDTVDSAIASAYANGSVIVAAAGNSNMDLDIIPSSPVCNDGGGSNNRVVGVAATTDDDTKASFSNYGSSCVDVSAPGQSIYAAVFYDPAYGFNTYYESFSGTSMATPMTSGVAALIKGRNPSWSNDQVRDRLIGTADDINAKNPMYSGELGGGRINARAAVGGSGGTAPAPTETRIVTGPANTGGPDVRGFTTGGTATQTRFNAFASTFRGGSRVAFGDIDADGEDEIITGAGPTGGPQIRVFEKDGTLRGIQFFAFHPSFRGGINIASGDVDGDGKDEIGVCQAHFGQAWCKVYRYNNDKTVVGEWIAFGSAEVGASIAMGDVDNDGKAEVIVGAGTGGGPQIRVFEANGSAKPIQFFAFHPNNRSGVYVASGDTDGDGKAEITACQGPGDEAWCKVYRYNNEKTVIGNFRAFPAGVLSGATVAMGDIDNDGMDEIITGASQGGGPQVRAFERIGTPKSTNFFAYDTSFKGGIFVAVSD